MSEEVKSRLLPSPSASAISSFPIPGLSCSAVHLFTALISLLWIAAICILVNFFFFELLADKGVEFKMAHYDLVQKFSRHTTGPLAGETRQEDM